MGMLAELIFGGAFILVLRMRMESAVAMDRFGLGIGIMVFSIYVLGAIFMGGLISALFSIERIEKIIAVISIVLGIIFIIGQITLPLGVFMVYAGLRGLKVV